MDLGKEEVAASFATAALAPIPASAALAAADVAISAAVDDTPAAAAAVDADADADVDGDVGADGTGGGSIASPSLAAAGSSSSHPATATATGADMPSPSPFMTAVSDLVPSTASASASEPLGSGAGLADAGWATPRKDECAGGEVELPDASGQTLSPLRLLPPTDGLSLGFDDIGSSTFAAFADSAPVGDIGGVSGRLEMDFGRGMNDLSLGGEVGIMAGTQGAGGEEEVESTLAMMMELGRTDIVIERASDADEDMLDRSVLEMSQANRQGADLHQGTSFNDASAVEWKDSEQDRVEDTLTMMLELGRQEVHISQLEVQGSATAGVTAVAAGMTGAVDGGAAEGLAAESAAALEVPVPNGAASAAEPLLVPDSLETPDANAMCADDVADKSRDVEPAHALEIVEESQVDDVAAARPALASEETDIEEDNDPDGVVACMLELGRNDYPGEPNAAAAASAAVPSREKAAPSSNSSARAGEERRRGAEEVPREGGSPVAPQQRRAHQRLGTKRPSAGEVQTGDGRSGEQRAAQSTAASSDAPPAKAARHSHEVDARGVGPSRKDGILAITEVTQFILHQIYDVWDEERRRDIPGMLQEYEGFEVALILAVVRKYIYEDKRPDDPGVCAHATADLETLSHNLRGRFGSCLPEAGLLAPGRAVEGFFQELWGVLDHRRDDLWRARLRAEAQAAAEAEAERPASATASVRAAPGATVQPRPSFVEIAAWLRQFEG